MPNGISYHYQLERPICVFSDVGAIFHFYQNYDRILCKQTVETLHCVPMYHKKDARLVWVKS